MTDLEPCAWPRPEDPGRYVIGCSCERYRFEGTAAEINAESGKHDDAPWRSHVVSVRGRIRADNKTLCQAEGTNEDEVHAP